MTTSDAHLILPLRAHRCTHVTGLRHHNPPHRPRYSLVLSEYGPPSSRMWLG